MSCRSSWTSRRGSTRRTPPSERSARLLLRTASPSDVGRHAGGKRAPTAENRSHSARVRDAGAIALGAPAGTGALSALPHGQLLCLARDGSADGGGAPACALPGPNDPIAGPLAD